MSSVIRVNGRVDMAPIALSAASSSWMDISSERSYGCQESGTLTVAALVGAPVQVATSSVPQARFLALRALDQTPMTAILSSVIGGPDQVVPFSDVLLISVSPVGSPLVAIKLAGFGRVSYLVAGDAPGSAGPLPALLRGWFRVIDRATLSALDATLYVVGATFFRCDENGGSYELIARGADPDDGTVFLTASVAGLQWRMF